MTMKIIGIAFLILSIFALGQIAPDAVSAQSTTDIICNQFTDPDCAAAAVDGTVDNLTARIVSVLSFIIGVASVIVIIIGGFMYVVSAGNSDTTTKAKNTILYALVGLVISVFAQAIVRFVLSSV